jgi:hypothetical protein
MVPERDDRITGKGRGPGGHAEVAPDERSDRLAAAKRSTTPLYRGMRTRLALPLRVRRDRG